MRNSRQSGKKNKYDVGELENVYEEVDEKEYAKTVLKRQEEDWIVDDGGCGYIEDGREIFDDDLDEESIEKSKTVSTGKKRGRDLAPASHKGSIRNMLAGMPAKKRKESSVKLEEDDILGDLIGELDSKSIGSHSIGRNSNKDFVNSANSSTKLPPKHIHVDYEEWYKITRGTDKEKVIEIKPEFKQEIVIKQEKIDSDEEKENDVYNEALLEQMEQEDIMIIDEEENKNKNLNEKNEIIIDGDSQKENLKLPNINVKNNVNLETAPEQLMSIIKETKAENFGEWEEANVPIDNPKLCEMDRSKLPLTKNGNDEEVLRFYYWDAHEEIFSQPGSVFLFGKLWIPSAETYVSCCVTVKNIERQIYLLPREKNANGDDVTMSDVYEEFNNKIAQKYKITQFKSKKTFKKYAFGKEDIPLESEYLEVRYSAKFTALPNDLSGETFSHIFGAKKSFLELLILERSIKGPGWIEISKPELSVTQISWCKVEVICNKPSEITFLKDANLNEIPPLTLVTLHPQFIFNPKTRQSEVIAVSCLVNHSYNVDKPVPERQFTQHFCVLSRPSDAAWPFNFSENLQKSKFNILKMDSERTLLNCLLTKLYKIDADIILGHDLSGFSIELIVNRLSFHKVPNWSRLGRLKRSTFPSSKNKAQVERLAVTGRLLCDIKLSSKELIKSRSYDLETLCQNVLHFKEDKRTGLSEEEFKSAFGDSKSLTDAVCLLMSSASYILRIFFELNVLPLALQITNIAGNILSRTLLGGRSERNEYLLLHAFYSKSFMLPDKEYSKKPVKEDIDEEDGYKVLKDNKSKKKPLYMGGLVIQPQIGFYDNLILVMDFNSLYPSIIQEYNICFTTVPINQVEMNDFVTDAYNKYIPSDELEVGILPIEIRKLVESRKDVKKLLKGGNLTPELRMQLDIRQTALKLTANSMYGCLGFTHSRFYARPLAAIVTAKGREILMNSRKIVESYGLDVIYGDTDSIMINTKKVHFDEVYQFARILKTDVNRKYRQVELDIDGVFKYLLLLKKKKYAAVSVTKSSNGEMIEKCEMKGLDIVRRDWSQLSAEAGKYMLKQILSAQCHDDKIEKIHDYLVNLRQDVEMGKIPLSLLTVTKQLTRQPEEYVDVKALPHVQVALRLNATVKKLKKGDTVSYVICRDGTNNSPLQRAYHIGELKSNNNLTIDTEYYLSQQIHPVVARLCAPIEGTDPATIAVCLGLDPSKYKRQIAVSGGYPEDEGIFGKNDIEKFKDCEKFTFMCKREGCGALNVIERPLRKLETGGWILFLEHCANQECNLRPIEYLSLIQNILHMKIRSLIQKYYEGWLLCEDTICNYRTNILGRKFSVKRPICPECKLSKMRREVSSFIVFNQLSYYLYIFDLENTGQKTVKYEPELVAAYKKVYNHVTQILNYNKYSIINLAPVFYKLFVNEI